MHIYEIEVGSIISYGPEQSIDLVKRLLWAEAWRMGIPRHRVNISGDVTVPDGGIDAVVETASSHDSILIAGKTYYQVKSGASFKPWQSAQIRNELFGHQDPSLSALGPEVRNGLETGASYCLITLGHDLTSEQRNSAKTTLSGFFAVCGFVDVTVEVLGAGEIAGVIGLHAALCLEINGLADVPFQSARSWQATADMTRELAMGVPQERFVTQIQNMLDDPAVQHLRLVGEPGIGKTRLALEAVSTSEKLSSEAMYFRRASDFQGSAFFNSLMREGQSRSALLIIDECENSDRTEIWAALKRRPGVKLVTIDHGPEGASGDAMRTLHAPPLDQQQIEKILSSYLPDNQLLFNWAEWCGGSARVAHALGENLRDHPDDILRSPDTVQIWERFISGYGSRNEQTRARTVLTHIALFEMFGFLPPVQEEADFIARTVRDIDPSITRQQFDQIVHYYQERKILQGDRTLRIVPKALRVYLWREWWTHFGASARVRDLLDAMPSSMRRWFMHPFSYSQDVRHAMTAIRALLDAKSGLFSEKGVMTSEIGAEFIAVLAQAAATETIELLRSVLTWTDSDLNSLRRERHSVAKALSYVAVWEQHFRAAAKILVRLSFGETSSYSNNCRGTLKGLFHPFAAPTQAPFAARAAFALEMIASSSEYDRELGLELCRSCLSIQSGSRIIDVEFQGTRPQIKFWQAKNFTDLMRPWTDVFTGLTKIRALHDEAWLKKVDETIISGAGELLRMNFLPELSLSTLSQLAEIPSNFDPIYRILSNIRRYPTPHLPTEILEQAAALKCKLDGNDFGGRLRRHVLSNVPEDDLDEIELNGKEKRDALLRSLAEEAASDLDVFRRSLSQLFTSEATLPTARFGEKFAIALGGDDLDQEILAFARQHAHDGTHPFVTGYLRGVFELDVARWERLSLGALESPDRWVCFAVVLSGASPAVSDRLIGIHSESVEDASWIAYICDEAYVGILGQEQRRRAIIAALEKSKSPYETAVMMGDRALCKTGDELDAPVAFAVLAAGSIRSASVMADYYWSELAARFLTMQPQSALELFRLLVQGTNSAEGIAAGGAMAKLAAKVAKADSASAWPIVCAALLGERAFNVRTWLGESRRADKDQLPAITFFNPADVFSWIDESPNDRAHIISGVLPKTLDPAEGGQLTHDFLARYLHIDDIGVSVRFRFGVGSFTGPRSAYLATRRSTAQIWLSQTTVPAVADWLEENIAMLSREIETAKINEERSLF